MKNCQVCGNPIFNYKNMGVNEDGSLNQDFCSDCYRNGKFVENRNAGDFNTFRSVLLPFASVQDMSGVESPGMSAYSPGFVAGSLLNEADNYTASHLDGQK